VVRRRPALQPPPRIVRTVLWPTGRQLRTRLPRLVAGLTVISLGIALMARSGTGLAPYEVFHQGLTVHTPLTLGRASIVTGVVVLLLWVPLRLVPGLGTVLNIVGVGLATDAFLAVVDEPAGALTRALFTVVGVAAIGVGIGLYIGAGLGPGPRDGLMTGLASRGWPVWAVRLVLELGALVAGWLLGGTVGVGTVLYAVTIGPLMHRTVPALRLRAAAPVPDVGQAAGRPA
jgi:uncharacterized membrane protein YczE